MQGIKISIHDVGSRLDIALLSLIGYVDTTTCRELTKVIQDLIRQKKYLIITDLGGVSYISSAGWGVFVGELKNIRDKGGDLKIVQMNPEVHEVFEMLEFNRILNYYESLEEAIDEFDILRGIDITKAEQKKSQSKEKPESIQAYPQAAPVVEPKGIRKAAQPPQAGAPVRNLPVMEKIKLIVIENPTWGGRWIRKKLRSEKYGSVRISSIRIRSLLKRLNLDTKDKRYRFYRSR